MKTLPAKTRIDIYRELGFYLKGGMRTFDAMISVHNNSNRKGDLQKFQATKTIIDRQAEGKSLSQALTGWIPPEMVSLIQSGEISNSLLEVLQSCIQIEKERMRILDKAGLSFSVSPAIWSFLDRAGIQNSLKDRIFPFPAYRRTIGACFLNSIKALLKAGMNEAVAVETLVDNNQGWYRQKLQAILNQLNKGNHLQDAIKLADPDFPDQDYYIYSRVTLPNTEAKFFAERLQFWNA